MPPLPSNMAVDAEKEPARIFPNSIKVWKLIQQSLDKDVPVMLMYVLESKGSSPGRQGFAMAVNLHGQMAGSVGGGIMEHKFVEMAKERLKEIDQHCKAMIRKQVHDKSAAKDQSGMICSGEQTILLYPVTPPNAGQVEAIINCLESQSNATLTLSPAGLQFSEAIPKKNNEFYFNSHEDWNYEEKIGYKQHLYIIGGGHCALALSRLMTGMDFFIHLYDDREGLNTMVENDFVHDKKLISGYHELSSLVIPGQNSYVVVMTVGYRTDEIAIRSLLTKGFAYFGVLGSSKKMEKLFSDYIAEGIDQTVLREIHAPVGIPINSHTPEEIAVSIAAQIIQVKNSG